MNTPNPPVEHVANHGVKNSHHGHPEHPPHPDPNLVTITLNRDKVITLRRGEYTGKELKIALGAPVDHELDLVVNGEFKPIGDGEKYHVRGGEHFVSQIGQGQSS